MIKADVLVNTKDWQKHISHPGNYLKKRLKKSNKKINTFKTNKFSFSLLLSGNEEIKKLNKKFRNKNKITDVLSFPFHEKKILNKLKKNKKKNIYLGDVIINLRQIIKKSKKKSFLEVFDQIWVHGLVHLLGYQHKSNKDFFVMQKLENKIIKSIK